MPRKPEPKERKVLILNKFVGAEARRKELQKHLDENWTVTGSVGENTVILERVKPSQREVLTD